MFQRQKGPEIPDLCYFRPYGVIPSGTVFQAERRACPELHGEGISSPRVTGLEIPRSADEIAGLRNDTSAIGFARLWKLPQA